MKLTKHNKSIIENECKPLIDKFKDEYIPENPDKTFNYLFDVYLKWRGNNLYFCSKYRSEAPNRLVNEFEEQFLRFQFHEKDSIVFSYMRHTGRWHVIGVDMTLKDCLDMIEKTPTFHPLS